MYCHMILYVPYQNRVEKSYISWLDDRNLTGIFWGKFCSCWTSSCSTSNHHQFVTRISSMYKAVLVTALDYKPLLNTKGPFIQTKNWIKHAARLWNRDFRGPFILHLDFWKSRSREIKVLRNQDLEKSRSVSNLRKFSGPANLDFFSRSPLTH